MNVNQLDDKLNQAITSFSSEIANVYKEGSRSGATESDISELARQTTYVLDDFRKIIVAYLKDL